MFFFFCDLTIRPCFSKFESKILVCFSCKYTKIAGITLKSLYPKLFHVTCVAHLLHNCAMKSNLTLKM